MGRAEATSPSRTHWPRPSGAWMGALLLVASSAGCGADRVTLPRGAVSVDGARIDPRLDVTESASTVEFEFTVAAETGGDCFSCTIKTLEASVGERVVVDAATGETVPADGDCFTELE